MAEYIDRDKLMENIDETVLFSVKGGAHLPTPEMRGANKVKDRIMSAPAADVVEVRHGEWVLTAHEESANYRWNVTAECSECHLEKGEIYAGFFLDFPRDIARMVLLHSAKTVKLDNYCPNCGAKMDGKGEGE